MWIDWCFRNHDAAFVRWMPHINLIYPYLQDTGDIFSKEAHKLLQQLATVNKFHISFTKDSFGYFRHGAKCTVWLKPQLSGKAVTTNQASTLPTSPMPRAVQPQPPARKVNVY